MGQMPSAADVDQMGGLELDALMHEIERAERRLAGLRSTVIARAEAAAFYSAWGFRSPKHWVGANANTSARVAAERVRIARVARALPCLHQALLDGLVGVDQALLLADLYENTACRGALVEMGAGMVRFAAELRLADFRLVVARFRAHADPDGTLRDVERAHERRRVRSLAARHGFELHAFGGALAGEEISAVLDHFTELEFQRDWQEAKAVHGDATTVAHLARTNDQRRFDALLAIFRAAKAATPAIATDPALFIVADAATTVEALLARYDLPVPPIDPSQLTERRCETINGTPITRAQLLAAVDVGRITVMLRTPGTRDVEVGRQQRFHNRAMRDAIAILDRFCSHPGCNRPARRCQIDHSEEWHRDGGVTGVRTGNPLCEYHNRAKHKLGLQMTWRPESGWLWFTAEGTPITPTSREPP